MLIILSEPASLSEGRETFLALARSMSSLFAWVWSSSIFFCQSLDALAGGRLLSVLGHLDFHHSALGRVHHEFLVTGAYHAARAAGRVGNAVPAGGAGRAATACRATTLSAVAALPIADPRAVGLGIARLRVT